MPVFDLKCPTCGREQKDVYVTSYYRSVRCECGGDMEHQPTAANFVVAGYSAKNGYTKESSHA